MSEGLLSLFRETLPDEISALVTEHLAELENGNFHSLFQSPLAQALLGHQSPEALKDVHLKNFESWNDYIFHRLGLILSDRTGSSGPEDDSPLYKQYSCFLIGYAALLAFLQPNVTGPPLPFASAKSILPAEVSADSHNITTTRQKLIQSLGVDGIAAYRLTPNIELLCLADAIMTSPPVLKHVPAARWAKMRVHFIHQRLLSEPSSTLQRQIYEDLELLEDTLFADDGSAKAKLGKPFKVQFVLERASIETFHGFDKRARADLDEASKEQGFQFALTGLLGKRTKWQEKETSQLVVLAKSAEDVTNGKSTATTSETASTAQIDSSDGQNAGTRPENLDLNDDTLLEAISFSEKPKSSTDVQDSNVLPPALAELDPSNQPLLQPLDSVILLALASSITNTSPANGLTREETIPYATRVLEGGSSNWQIYTQALLVRSRIEGYKSRTIERGLLQLQALVDQVIADTASSSEDGAKSSEETSTSFLPRPKESESASASERLKYVFQLASPSRWELEAELAARWVQLGGLRSALEIYERLEMWAEAALCWAATEKEDKAKRIVRRQLYHPTKGGPDSDVDEDEEWQGAERDPPPADAPRLYCILGDVDQDPSMWEKAWEVSNQRYARAQRSLGRFYFAANDHLKAAAAYSKSLNVNQLNHPSWFALGCALLELGQYSRAVESFQRCVQLDETDAEAWSNLAAALLKLEPEDEAPVAPVLEAAADEEEDVPIGATEERKVDPQKNRRDALRALKRAASIKYDSYRIWENLLIIAASISPPDYTSILSAQKHLIDIRGPTVGERCIDVEIMELLVRHVIALNEEGYDPARPGFERIMVECFDKQIIPLITASRPLWQLVSKLALWRKKPSSALEAHEKAWRAVTNQPGWDSESEARWNEVVDATVELCDAYESLGPREKTEGLGAGDGALVAKDWKFKARSAIRGIMGKGKDAWEGTDGWERLKDALDQLKN
ncbi:hypothetical protein M8818_001501 [Zalaria obscura]|uniref:Uncharacterized protein n=1 Tax=Zalaria obscura TaxID=2024903 RepID=A0ACC3SLX7_9PEZI